LQRIEILNRYIPITMLWAVSILILGWVLYILLHRKLFPAFNALLLKISFLSLVIQLLQLISFFCILYGFSIAPDQWLLYGILFYTGSVLSALPLSINGLGIREWVLVTGSTLLVLDSAKAFSASLVFTLISGICALIGGVIKHREHSDYK